MRWGWRLQQIRAGVADVMLTGGSEAMLCFGGVKAWEGLRVLSPDACRPFSLGRKGMVIGDGAGVLVFEAEDHARARGATDSGRGGRLRDDRRCGRHRGPRPATVRRGRCGRRWRMPGWRRPTSATSTRMARGRWSNDRSETAAIRAGLRGGAAAGVVDQGDAWPCHRCHRRAWRPSPAFWR